MGQLQPLASAPKTYGIESLRYSTVQISCQPDVTPTYVVPISSTRVEAYHNVAGPAGTSQSRRGGKIGAIGGLG